MLVKPLQTVEAWPAKAIQWNLSNMDTLEPLKCVLIRGLSSFEYYIFI